MFVSSNRGCSPQKPPASTEGIIQANNERLRMAYLCLQRLHSLFITKQRCCRQYCSLEPVTGDVFGIQLAGMRETRFHARPLGVNLVIEILVGSQWPRVQARTIEVDIE